MLFGPSVTFSLPGPETENQKEPAEEKGKRAEEERGDPPVEGDRLRRDEFQEDRAGEDPKSECSLRQPRPSLAHEPASPVEPVLR